MKKLKISKNTLRLLAGADLENARGGVVGDVYTGGDATVVHTNCESVACPGTRSCMRICDPWPPPPN